MRHTGYRGMGRLAALCSLLLLIAAGATASAHSTPPRASSPALPSSASPQGSGNLTTGGGHIQQRPVSYVVFWGAAWGASGSLTGDGQIAVNYLSDVGQTGYEKIVSQYYDSSAYISATHTLTPDWIDTTNPTTDTTCGAQTVQDTAIQHEVSHAIAVNGWPTDGANATYYVYTPTGYSVNDGAGNCSETQFCSYHNWSSSLSVAYAVIPYPNDMTACGVPSSPNGNAGGDSLANLTAQAQAGSITDPNAASGWADSQGNEASAKRAWDFSNGTTTLTNGGVFELQSQYSNASQNCVTNLPTTGDSVGVFHPSTGAMYLKNDATVGGGADFSFSYGSGNDVPVAGHWY